MPQKLNTYKKLLRRNLEIGMQKQLPPEAIARRIDSVIDLLDKDWEHAIGALDDIPEEAVERTVPPEIRERFLARERALGRERAPQVREIQLRKAADWPHEYVIFSGTELIGHTPDKREASQRYREALELMARTNDPWHPIVIPPEPERSETQSPVFRGRSLAGQDREPRT